MQKNVAGQKWIVFAFDRTDNTPKTGDAANITANLRIDGGAVNAIDDTNPAELEDGFYIFDLTQAETNGALLLISPASITADIQVIGVPGALYTRVAQTGDAYAAVNGLTIPTAAQIRTEIDSNSTQLIAILQDTGTTLDGKLDTIAGYLDTEIAAILANTGTTLDGKIDAIDTVVDAIRAVTDNLADTMEDDGGTQRFTANALEQAPSDTGGDASAANQATIITHLNDIKGTGFVKDTHSQPQCLTGAGGSAPTVQEIRAEFDTNSTQMAVLIARLTAARAGYLDKLNVAGTLAHSDAANIYKADISALATGVALAAVKTVVDTVQGKTDNLSADPADQSLIEAAITSAHGTTDTLLGTIAGYLDTEITTILTATGTTIPDLITALNIPDAATIADAVLDDVLTDLSDNSLNSGQSITLRKAARALFNRFYREVTQTATMQTVKNDSGATVAAMQVSDDGTTQTKGIAT